MTEDLRSTRLYQFMVAKCSAWQQAGWHPVAYVSQMQRDQLSQDLIQDANFAWVQICGLLRNPETNFVFSVLNAVAMDLGFEWGVTLTIIHDALLAACDVKRGRAAKMVGIGTAAGVVGGVLVSHLKSPGTESIESQTSVKKKNPTTTAKRKGTRKS